MLTEFRSQSGTGYQAPTRPGPRPTVLGHCARP
jgi:hypothetical protein